MKTNLLKKLFIILLSWMPFTHASADTGYLTLWFKSGYSIQISLDKQPQMTFDGTTVHLTTTEDEDNEMTFQFAEVSYFSLQEGEETTGVPNPSNKKTSTSRKKVTMKLIDNGVEITDGDGNDIIKIATINGNILNTLRADENGSAFIDLSNEPHGVYIIKVGIIPFVIVK